MGSFPMLLLLPLVPANCSLSKTRVAREISLHIRWVGLRVVFRSVLVGRIGSSRRLLGRRGFLVRDDDDDDDDGRW